MKSEMVKHELSSAKPLPAEPQETNLLSENIIPPKVHFGALEYDGTDLKTFPLKLAVIIKHQNEIQLGPKNAYYPTDVVVTPSLIEDDHFIVVETRVETAAPRGLEGVMQVRQNLFDIVTDETDAWIHHRPEKGHDYKYKLTTVEALILVGLTRQAAVREGQTTPIDRDLI